MSPTRKSIMVVDDEPLTRKGLTKTLETWSAGRYQILAADSGAEALDILRESTVHLLITDIRMPEMNGLHLVEKLNDTGHKPVVIIISGHPDFDYAQTAIQLGVVNYLLKPLNKKKLIDAVEKALQIEGERERVGTMEKLVDTKLLDAKTDHPNVAAPVSEAIRYVEEHIGEAFGLREVAEHIHLNPSYLSTLFKEQMELTFSEYVTRSRLQKAKELLLNSKLPIAEIAEAVGYQTAKYFITLFKEYEGKSPAQYRKENLDTGSEI
ncbi:response regulator transcription factor [Paenibacillus hexagrammi]|uniref:Response regulator n=1 Tax=Paenibacillus hexagrammi TaxID=2908839 RepID=A0ABY3SNU2_9BACL|nr:response regulator [Paenibacillus sp. YPD9-1]UJF34662.1 response regulator [Paenibacillus sp. YPD9-1]